MNESVEYNVITDKKIPLWDWHEAVCSECGSRQVIEKSRLDGRMKGWKKDLCECFKPDLVGRAGCGVVWSEACC